MAGGSLTAPFAGVQRMRHTSRLSYCFARRADLGMSLANGGWGTLSISTVRAKVRAQERTKPGRPSMEPIEVAVDEDGKVTVIINHKNGKRGEVELSFNLANDLLMELRVQLESFENRRGWR